MPGPGSGGHSLELGRIPETFTELCYGPHYSSF